MVSHLRRLAEAEFASLCEHMAVAIVHCSDQQLLDLADSLHAALRRRQGVLGLRRRAAGNSEYTL